MLGKVHSIETFGTVDGPGIRFVLFMQGCPLRCQYCHNPDTWNMNGGTEMSVAEILKQYESYRPFLKDGGLTVTGGEPLLQIDFLIELFEEAKKRAIHTCIDTSGITFNLANESYLEKLERLMKVTDLILLDIKEIDDETHITVTGTSNKPVLAFEKWLDEKGIPVWIRHVIVPGLTLIEEDLFQLGYFLGQFHNIKTLDILPYHEMGVVKWKQLGLDYPLVDSRAATDKEAKEAREVVIKGMKQYRKEHIN